jgi:5-methylcytosine-specific restriction endonuclease McrA
VNAPVIIPPRKSLTRAQRVKMFDSHGGICVICGLKILVGSRWIDEHINPREISGDDSMENRGPAHVFCAKQKTKIDQKTIAKVNRVRAKHLGIRKPSRFSCSRNSKFKKKIDGSVVLRGHG